MMVEESRSPLVLFSSAKVERWRTMDDRIVDRKRRNKGYWQSTKSRKRLLKNS